MDENNNMEQRYRNCLSILETQANLEQLEFVRAELSDLGDYSDAKRMLGICIGRIEECHEEMAEQSKKQEESSARTVQKNKNKKMKKLIILSVCLVGLVTAFILISTFGKNDATQLMIGKTFAGYYDDYDPYYNAYHATHRKYAYTVKILDDTYCELEYTFDLSYYSGDQQYRQNKTEHTVCKYKVSGLLFTSFFNWEGADEIRAAKKDFKITIADGKLTLSSEDFESGHHLTLSETTN